MFRVPHILVGVSWTKTKRCGIIQSTTSQRQGRRHGVTIGGGRGPFEVDAFHATHIGIMLNAEKFAGDRFPPPPGADPGGGRWGARSPLGRSYTIQNALFNSIQAPVHHWAPTPGRNPASAPAPPPPGAASHAQTRAFV